MGRQETEGEGEGERGRENKRVREEGTEEEGGEHLGSALGLHVVIPRLLVPFACINTSYTYIHIRIYVLHTYIEYPSAPTAGSLYIQ
jgi:hypothetical protein